ncbi:MAG: DUF6339 family protein [Solibacillus sp.]|uniref:DUF6339 family protein n=1 Tax=Solibacillus sp. TaxID=1909654 RepID=UPI003315B09C
MKLNYLKEDAVIQLKENILNNIDFYQSGEKWIGKYLENALDTESWFLESRITFQKANLIIPGHGQGSKTDAENAIRLHHSLKNLTPAQATDQRIWTYLTHNVYPDYMAARWLQKVSKGSLERYFASTNRLLIRNGIARLWWYGYLTYDENRENPYELTKFALSNQDIVVSLLERNLGNSKNLFLKVLDILYNYTNIYPTITSSKNITSLSKYINFCEGVTLLDSMSKGDLKYLVDKWIFKEGLAEKEAVTS